MRTCVIFAICFLTQSVFADSQWEAHEPWPIRCARIKLKRGALEETRKWFQTMGNSKEAFLAIIEGQGVLVEAVFLDHVGEDDYLIYFMKEESRERSRQFQSHDPLSKGHQEYKKTCWAEKFELEPLLNMDTIR